MAYSNMDILEIAGHSSSLLKQVLALQAEDILCDVRLTSQGGGVSAHRLVLMAASPYLKTRLSAEYRAGRGKDLIHFNNIPLSFIERVVKYLYTGMLEVCPSDVEQLIKFCEDLELGLAVEACKDYMNTCGDVPVTTKSEVLSENGADIADIDEFGSKSKNRRVQRMPRKRIKENATSDEEEIEEHEEMSAVKKKRGRPPNKQEKQTNVKQSKGRPKTQALKLKIEKESSDESAEELTEDTENMFKHTVTEIVTGRVNNKMNKNAEPVDVNLDEDCTEEIREALVDLGKLTEQGLSAKSIEGGNSELNDQNVENITTSIASSEDESDEQNLNDTNTKEKHKIEGDTTKVKAKSEKKTAKVSKKVSRSKAVRKTQKNRRKKNDDEETEKPRKRTYIKVRRQKTFPCSTCTKILSSHKRLMFHEFSKHGAPYNSEMYTIFPCKREDCTYVAANRHNLDTHMKSRHGVDRPHICEFCGKAFKLPNVLATHINIHTGKKLWNCEQCGERFNQQSGLDVHIKRHHIGEASWAELCHLCSEKFLQKSELVWHLFKNHDVPLPAKYKAYICDICNYLTKSSQDLQRHQNAHKGLPTIMPTFVDAAIIVTYATFKFVCDICGYKSRKGHDFERHTNAHAGIKQFTCPICQKSCSTKSELKRHVRFHGEKSFKCTFGDCTYACVDTIGLGKHIKLMHTHKNFKPFACPVCPYRTGVKGNVDKHIRTVHNLDVVTKHTVHLKMKYSNFQSGDIITKDGRLVATAQDRKELEQCPPENKDDGGMVDAETAMSVRGISNINDNDEHCDDNTVIIPNPERLKAYLPHPPVSRLAHSSQSEISDSAENQPELPSGQSGERYLTSLSNYVYPQSGTLSSGSAQTGLAVMAQDLRMSGGSAGSDIYQMDQGGGVFMAQKYGYQDQ